MNCIVIDDDTLCRKVLNDYIGQTEFLNQLGEFETPVEAMNTLINGQVDLLFLDIEMPKMTGIDLIKSLENKPITVLITSHEEFAVEAFEYNVMDYIVKPVSYARFFKAVNRAQELHKKHVATSGDEFFVKSSGTLVKIDPKKLLWVEALENYMVFNTIDKKHTVHVTMKALEEKLPANEFIRVHRSFIVRKDKIESITEDEIIIGNKKIPVGRTYKKELANKIKLL
ncbi:MAG: DNA-binding response regulator [Flavobacteriales bacterium]|nr:MAG: DNA-binding response regulator [Flavobacteriales bacterium]